MDNEQMNMAMNKILLKTIALVLVQALVILDCACSGAGFSANDQQRPAATTLAPKLLISSDAFTAIFTASGMDREVSGQADKTLVSAAKITKLNSQNQLKNDWRALFYFAVLPWLTMLSGAFIWALISGKLFFPLLMVIFSPFIAVFIFEVVVLFLSSPGEKSGPGISELESGKEKPQVSQFKAEIYPRKFQPALSRPEEPLDLIKAESAVSGKKQEESVKALLMDHKFQNTKQDFKFSPLEKYLLLMPFVFLGTVYGLLFLEAFKLVSVDKFSAFIMIISGFFLVILIPAFLELTGLDKSHNETISDELRNSLLVPQSLFASTNVLMVWNALKPGKKILLAALFFFSVGFIAFYAIQRLMEKGKIKKFKPPEIWFSRKVGQDLARENKINFYGKRKLKNEFEQMIDQHPRFKNILNKIGGADKIRLSRAFGWKVIAADGFFYIDQKFWQLICKNKNLFEELIVLLCCELTREIAINEQQNFPPGNLIYFAEINAIINQINYLVEAEELSPGTLQSLKTCLHNFSVLEQGWKEYTVVYSDLFSLVEIFLTDKTRPMPELYAQDNTITQLGINLITEFIEKDYSDYEHVSIKEIEAYFHAQRSCQIEKQGLGHIIKNPIKSIGGFLRRLLKGEYSDYLKTKVQEGISIVEEIEKRLRDLEESCLSFECTLHGLVKRIESDIARLCVKSGEVSSQPLVEPVLELRNHLNNNKEIYIKEQEIYFNTISQELGKLEKSLEYLEKLIEIGELQLQPVSVDAFVNEIKKRAMRTRLGIEKQKKAEPKKEEIRKEMAQAVSRGEAVTLDNLRQMIKRRRAYDLEFAFPDNFEQNEDTVNIDYEKVIGTIDLLLNIIYEDLMNGLGRKKITISGLLSQNKFNLFIECKGLVIPDRVFMLLSMFYFHYHYGKGTWLEEIELLSGEKGLFARSTVLFQFFKLIEAHGGELNMNQDIEGTVFIITLPVQRKITDSALSAINNHQPVISEQINDWEDILLVQEAV